MHIALMMSENKIYLRVLDLGKSDPEALLLDIGCCMGTDVRKASFDGFPGPQIFACDLLPEFIALGYKLFCDKNTQSIHFFAANIFSLPRPSHLAHISTPIDTPISEVASLSDLVGRVSVVYTGSLFHLFDEQT